MDDPIDVKETETETPVESSSTKTTEGTTQAEAESVTPEAKAEEAESPKEEVKSEEAPKKGAQHRIQELVSEKKQAEDKAQSLEAKLAELTRPVGQVAQPQYVPQVQPGQEVTQDQYRQDVLKTADTMVNLKIKQSEAVSRINAEAKETITKYPVLDPESDQFDKELSDSVTTATLAYVKSEPYTASPKTFVETLMKPYQRAVTKEVGKQSETIAKQVSNAALRPTTVQSKEKNVSDMSTDELEKKLGVVY